MENMYIYTRGRVVPKEAKKEIKAGRIKGFTDINPMWRIKILTEIFGPCGIGWYYEISDKQIVQQGNETCAFVDINLYIRDESGEWSKPIYGCGGSRLLSQEKSGGYVSDEAFKMAQTDALSVACKNLGIGADVYYEKDTTKYQTSGSDIEKRKAEADAYVSIPEDAKASKKQVEALCNKCAEYDIDIGYIKQKFKLDNIEDIGEREYVTCERNYDRLKANSDRWREKQNASKAD